MRYVALTFALALAIIGAPIAIGLAQTPAPVTEAPATPEQTAIKVIQQQRNTAQAKADDLTAQLAIIQGMMQADQKYWAAYVKGLSPAPEKPADK